MLDVNDFKCVIRMFRDREGRLCEAYRAYTWRGHKLRVELFNDMMSTLPEGSAVWVDREMI